MQSVQCDAFTPTTEQNETWGALFTRQMPRVKKHASRDFLTGLDLLDLPEDRIPSLDEMNRVMTPRTGWRTVRTSVRYTDAVPWYGHFAAREFLITDYMRERHELDFTPEPDMFHDIFGHQPFMVHEHYTDLQEMFAPVFLRATDEQRECIKRLAWYSTEFGMIREEGELKVFGAGILSSATEIEHVMAGKTPILPFTIENVIPHEKAIWNLNEVLFVFDSVDALKRELSRYFDTI